MKLPKTLLCSAALLTGTLQMPAAFAVGKPLAPAIKLADGSLPTVTIIGGEKRRYSIELRQGQFVRIVAQQMGIDLGLTLTSPSGVPLIDADSPNGLNGPEPISFLVPKSGVYRLEIEAFKDDDAKDKKGKGQFTLNVARRSAASPTDRTRMRAETLLQQGSQNLSDEKLTPAIQKYEASLPLWNQLKDDYWKETVLSVLGTMQLAKSDFASAIARFDEALPLQRKVKDRGGEADTLQGLGLAYAALGHFDSALQYDRQALAVYQELKDAGKVQEVKDAMQQAQDGIRAKAQVLTAF